MKVGHCAAWGLLILFLVFGLVVPPLKRQQLELQTEESELTADRGDKRIALSKAQPQRASLQPFPSLESWAPRVSELAPPELVLQIRSRWFDKLLAYGPYGRGIRVTVCGSRRSLHLWVRRLQSKQPRILLLAGALRQTSTDKVEGWVDLAMGEAP